MPKQATIPRTEQERNELVAFLNNGTIPAGMEGNPQRVQAFKRHTRHFFMRRGLLMARDTKGYEREVVCGYEHDRKIEIMTRYHEPSHVDFTKTHTRIYESYIGITQEEVRSYVSKCPACRRGSSVKSSEGMETVTSHKPLGHVEADLVDMHAWEDENDGFTFILTIVDVMTKFAWAIPLLFKYGFEVADVTLALFLIVGFPNIFHSDNGSEFAGQLEFMLKKFGVEQRHGRAYHPQAQGQVERFNQTLVRRLTKAMWNEETKTQGHRWIDLLGRVVFDYNDTIHTSHGKTPFEVMYGRPGHPTPPAARPEGEGSSATLPTPDILAEIDAARTRIQAEVAAKQSKYTDKLKRVASLHQRTVDLQPGDIVAVAPDTTGDRRKKRKMELTFDETGEIERLLHNNRWLINVRTALGTVEQRVLTSNMIKLLARRPPREDNEQKDEED